MLAKFQDKVTWLVDFTTDTRIIKNWYCYPRCLGANLVNGRVYGCNKYPSSNSLQSGSFRVCLDCYNEHLNEYILKYEL
jgi:hypothetical protein